jgi:AcrR family transcriptional regulator
MGGKGFVPAQSRYVRKSVISQQSLTLDARQRIAPRKPQRANGLLRYEVLLDAAERLLISCGPDALTIQRLAVEAEVPMASVYHFFPGPAAVSIGLAERYLAGLAEVIGQPVADADSQPWQAIVATLMDRAVAYYVDHPYAQQLILGSDHSWQIRQFDLANNRLLAEFVADLLESKFPQADRSTLLQAIIVAISVGDAVLALAVAEPGGITPDSGHEATLAICGYMTGKFGEGQPPVVD